MTQKSLEGVIYYASYLVTELDEEKKKKGLEDLSKTIELRKAGTRKKKSKPKKKAIEKELQDKLKDASKTKVKGEQKVLNESGI